MLTPEVAVAVAVYTLYKELTAVAPVVLVLS